MTRELSRNRLLLVMISPAVIWFLVFSYLPIAGIYMAFTRYNVAKGLFRSPFVGLQNFAFLFHSNTLWRLLRNTIGYNLAFIFIGNIAYAAIGILVSFMMHKPYKRLCQTILFLPFFVSFVLVGSIAYNLLSYEFGAVNTLLHSFGMPRINVYNTPVYWIFLIPAFYIWKTLGYGSVIYLATITSIDPTLYESADIDGATVVQKIRYITIPHLMATFVLLVLFALGRIMRGQFELFYQLIGTNGLLYNATDIIDTYVFRALTVNFDVGLGSAAGLFQSAFGFALILTVNWIIRRTHEDYALF